MRKPRVVCIGNGLAAMQLALFLHDDVELFILSSSDNTDSNSYLANLLIEYAILLNSSNPSFSKSIFYF